MTTTDYGSRGGKAPITTNHFWATVVTIVLLIAGSFAFAYLRAASTADCVNNVLAVRGPLQQADHDNEKQKIADQELATNDQEAGFRAVLVAKTPRQALAALAVYQHGIDEFRQALDGWVARDAAITKQKQLHPLGRC